MKFLKFIFCSFLLLIALSNAAPGLHLHNFRRGDLSTECDDWNFSSCHAIINRVDHMSGLCQIKDQIESCVVEVMSDRQCTTIKKESKMAKTMQKLADMNCKAECLMKMQEIANVSDIDFWNDEEFCSVVDRIISLARYLLDNCQQLFSDGFYLTNDSINSLKGMKSGRCGQTVPPVQTTDAITTPPVTMETTEAATVPPFVTTKQQTSFPPFVTTGQPVYKCFDVFKCPSTSMSSLVPGGNLTTGFTFSETYFQNVCNYIEELFQCHQYTDFSGCKFLNSVIDGYAQYYGTLCMDTQQKGELLTLIPCMNVHSLQLHVFAAMAKMMGSLETILTWPNYLGLQDTTKTMYCRAYHSFVNNAATYADHLCGAGHDPIVRSILKALGALAEQNLGHGCVEQNSYGPDIQWSFFLPAETDDLFDDDTFGGMFGDK